MERFVEERAGDDPSAGRVEPLVPIRPMLLSHHYYGHEDRCVTLGRVHVCRRCMVLYPIAFAVLFLSAGGVGWPTRFDQLLLLLLPAPVAIEYVLEQLGHLRYNARRQVLVTMVAAPALGRAFHRYLSQPDDASIRWVLAGYGGAGIVAWLFGVRRTSKQLERRYRAQMEWADVDFDNQDQVNAVLARLAPNNSAGKTSGA